MAAELQSHVAGKGVRGGGGNRTDPAPQAIGGGWAARDVALDTLQLWGWFQLPARPAPICRNQDQAPAPWPQPRGSPGSLRQIQPL